MTRSRGLLSLLVALTARLAVAADASESSITRPFQGITLIERSETAPRPIKTHVVLVDLTAPGIAFKLTPPSGRRDTVRQTTLEFLVQEKAQVAINVHFFVPFPSEETEVDLVGLAASEGKIYSPFESQPVGPAYPDQSYAIVVYAPAFNIDQANRIDLVRRDPNAPDNRSPLPRMKLWNAIAGSAQIVTDGRKTIPTYSGDAAPLKTSKTYSDAHSWYGLPRARTAAGMTADRRTLVLFTADQAAGSTGMTVAEVAECLIRDYHVTQALNLDGGGSTTIAMQDPVTRQGRIVNTSSDNPRGRSVGSSLAVFATPAAASTAPTPP